MADQKKTHVSDGTAASEAKSGHDTRCKTSVTELDEKGPESRRRGDGTADRLTVGDVAWVVRHSWQPRPSVQGVHQGQGLFEVRNPEVLEQGEL